jgi:hypothetical protein
VPLNRNLITAICIVGLAPLLASQWFVVSPSGFEGLFVIAGIAGAVISGCMLWSVRAVISALKERAMAVTVAAVTLGALILFVSYSSLLDRALVPYGDGGKILFPLPSLRPSALAEDIQHSRGEKAYIESGKGPGKVEEQLRKPENAPARLATLSILLGTFCAAFGMTVGVAGLYVLRARPSILFGARYPAFTWRGSPPKVFISYFRGDSRYAAARLADDLSQPELLGRGRVFRDVRNIALGGIFPDILEKELLSSDTVLAVVGPRWISLLDASGKPRIWDPQSWVRRELALAHQHGKRIVPVLLDDTQMPTPDQFPQPPSEEIENFCSRQALRLLDEYWRTGVKDLVKELSGQSFSGEQGM